jgi:hypothetical protein
MSFDLAVWDGPVPSTHEEAARVFQGLYRQYLDTERPVAPTAAIAAVLAELLTRWPDGVVADGVVADGAAPWSWGPMALNASGPLLYFGIDLPRCDALDVPAVVTELAGQHDLIYYDPQSEQVLVPAGVRRGAANVRVTVPHRRGLLTRLRRG